MKFYKEMWRTIAHGRIWHGDVKNWRKDGSEYWLKATIVPFLDESGKPFQYVSIRTDITDQKQAVKLKVMAHHDPLTGLPNRNLFGDRLMLAIAQPDRLSCTHRWAAFGSPCPPHLRCCPGMTCLRDKGYLHLKPAQAAATSIPAASSGPAAHTGNPESVLGECPLCRMISRFH